MKKILLVEPDSLLAKSYSQYLINNGFSVKVSHHVQKAVDEIDTELPDVVILELQIASHNGYEFLYELRSYMEWQDIPVIIHTSVPIHVSSMNDQIMKQLGVVSYLYKPSTSLSKLLYAVDDSLTVSKK
jgi:DNA-binding response OmpR family regulator